MSKQPPVTSGRVRTGASRDRKADPASLPRADDNGRFPIRIARDGTWFYRNSPINRIAMARLFSTVLRRDAAGNYWLVTPFEKGMIDVDDAPFTAVEMETEGAGREMSIRFRTNLDEWITAGPDNPIAVTERAPQGEPAPYVRVRNGLDALIVRPVFYALVDIAEPAATKTGQVLRVWSEGAPFDLGPAE